MDPNEIMEKYNEKLLYDRRYNCITVIRISNITADEFGFIYDVDISEYDLKNKRFDYYSVSSNCLELFEPYVIANDATKVLFMSPEAQDLDLSNLKAELLSRFPYKLKTS